MPISAPVGSQPFGVGTPLVITVPPKAERTRLSRFIDPFSGDYAIDEDTGHQQQMPPVRQRWLLLLRERLGSSTVRPLDGIQLPKIIDEQFDRRVIATIRGSLAVQQMTQVEKVSTLDDVQVDRKETGGRVRILISYTDLSTNESGTVDGLI